MLINLMLLIFVEIVTILDDVQCLRIIRLEVPPSVPKGEAVTLRCHYDLESDELYSVKWYKDYVEFYRYMPMDGFKTFSLKGVHVDRYKSSANHTFLSETDLASEGHYACEVSTESPAFRTVRAERQMKVYVLPKKDLSIEGGEPLYGMADTINLTCIAHPSNPPQLLTWYINGVKASPDQLVKYPREKDSFDGDLHASKLGLLFKANSNHFVKGSLQLKCSASISLVYRYEASITLSGGTPKNDSIDGHFTSREDRLNQREPETPIIEGGKDKYQVGSLMDLNCSTSSEATLKWFIKSDEVSQDQLIRYLDEQGHLITLGLRFKMEKRHFQMQELRLKCIAFYHYTIANSSKTLTIRTYGREDSLIVDSDIDYSDSNNSLRDKPLSSIFLTCVIGLFLHSLR